MKIQISNEVPQFAAASIILKVLAYLGGIVGLTIKPTKFVVKNSKESLTRMTAVWTSGGVRYWSFKLIEGEQMILVNEVKPDGTIVVYRSKGLTVKATFNAVYKEYADGKFKLVSCDSKGPTKTSEAIVSVIRQLDSNVILVADRSEHYQVRKALGMVKPRVKPTVEPTVAEPTVEETVAEPAVESTDEVQVTA